MAKSSASGSRSGTRKQSDAFVPLKTTPVFELGGRTTANNRFVPVRCKILNFLPVSLNQSSFFGFFESSIMRKIGLGSRLGCRACCVSGMALSEGGFAFNTRLVYFVSEQVFPSGAYFKSALPPYLPAGSQILLFRGVVD